MTQRDYVLCLVTGSEAGSSIITMEGLAPEDYECIAALVVRSTLNAGGTLKGILEMVAATEITAVEPTHEPMVIS